MMYIDVVNSDLKEEAVEVYTLRTNTFVDSVEIYSVFNIGASYSTKRYIFVHGGYSH